MQAHNLAARTWQFPGSLVTEINDEQAAMLRDGFQLLVGYLGLVQQGFEDDEGPVH